MNFSRSQTDAIYEHKYSHIAHCLCVNDKAGSSLKRRVCPWFHSFSKKISLLPSMSITLTSVSSYSLFTRSAHGRISYYLPSKMFSANDISSLLLPIILLFRSSHFLTSYKSIEFYLFCQLQLFIISEKLFK